HRSHLNGMRRYVSLKSAFSQDLLIYFYLFIKLQTVWDLYLHDPVEDRFISVVRLELIPLSLIRMSKDNAVEVDHRPLPRRWYVFLLCCSDHCMKIFCFILENFNEFDNAPVADIKRTIQRKDSGIVLRIEIYPGNIDTADKHARILIVRIYRRYYSDTFSRTDGKPCLYH